MLDEAGRTRSLSVSHGRRAPMALAFKRNRFSRTIAYLARDRMMPPGPRSSLMLVEGGKIKV